MTTLARPTTQIERLRRFARQFADALPTPHPLQRESNARAFWLVLVALVVDDSTVPDDLTTNPVLGIYAAAVAAEFLDLERDFEHERDDFMRALLDAPALPAPTSPPGPRAAFSPCLAAHSTGRTGDAAPSSSPTGNPTAAGPGAPSRTGSTSQQKWDGESVGSYVSGSRVSLSSSGSPS